ncbi:MAG: hypothetical protein E7628_01285 [Ruminococcaceae bacterium]|nr:hypothetical protein [Oscillospiraceae bacterium]
MKYTMKLICTVLMVAMLLGIALVASGVEMREYESESITFNFSGDLPSNDELFAGYVNSIMYPEAPVTLQPQGTLAKQSLSYSESVIYDIMLAQVKKVANGETSDSRIHVTASELNARGINTTYTASSIESAYRQFMHDYQIDLADPAYALIYDHPYELYWFDKTVGSMVGYEYTASDGVITITEFVYYFQLVEDYRLDIEDPFTVNTAKTGAAVAAYNNARKIVSSSASLDDYSKLVMYDAEIRELTDYNYEAINNDFPYGDPWQVIWVFDNDPSTKVVCEGYAKAFQLLCDLSDFEQDIVCVSVSGDANGAHMWNIVKMDDGNNYLVDVTWNDSTPGKYFLKGGVGSVAGGYTVSGSFRTYDDLTRSLFGDDSILRLCSSEYKYVPGDGRDKIASGECGDALTWILYTDGDLVIYGSGDMWDYDYSNNKAPWYTYRNKMKKLTLSEGISSIGKYAFDGCSNIKGALSMPDTVTRIGDYAFYSCGFTGELTLSDNLEYIGEYAFYFCYGFRGSLTIPEGTVTIGNNAFCACNGFSGDLIIPEGVKTIGTSAFWNCSKLTGNLVLPDSLEYIGEGAFQNCSFTGTLLLPESVTVISNNAFQSCDFTGILILPDTVTKIGNYAFAGCSGITEVVIPAGVTSVGNECFNYCSALTTATVYSTNAAYGLNVFANSHADFTIYGYTGSTAEAYAKNNNHQFVTLTTRTIIDSGECGDNLTWTLYADGELVIEGTGDMWDYDASYVPNLGKHITFAPWGTYENRLTKLTLTEGITLIGNNAFYGCSGFTGELVIPDSVTTIGDGAFYYCSGFTGKLVLPNSVTSIYPGAFCLCTGFTGELIIPDKITGIGSAAFGGCSGFTGDLVIPNSVTLIGFGAFSGCSGFTGDLIIGDSVTTIDYMAFQDCVGLKKVFFKGNSPFVSKASDDSRSFDADVTLYYLPSTTGWTDSEYYDADAKTWNGYKLKVWTDGITLSGTATSFGTATDEVTIALFVPDATEASYTVKVTGNTATYTIEGVAAGTYTMTVEKNNHVTREYELVIGEEDVTQDVKIHLKGDLDGNGKVNTRDWNAVRDHINKSAVITDSYMFACADIDGNGKVNTRDWNAIRDHINKSNPLW